MQTRPGEVSTLSASGVNLAATVTIPAFEDTRAYVSKIVFSYSATPTNGVLVVQVDGVTKLTLPITAAGPGPLNTNIRGAVDRPITVSLSAGGSGITGSLYVEYLS